jgi:neutral ceramidase
MNPIARPSRFTLSLSGLRRAALGLGLALLLAVVTDVQAAAQMRAGAAVADITPKKFPVPMSGSMTPRWATQAHDPLSARCLVLDDGATRIAFCVIDSCATTLEIMEAAKDQAHKLTGIPVERICMSATHTHTGVSVGIGFQTPSANDEYVQYMIKQIAAGIKQAADRLEPAQVGWAYADEPRHVGNRRWLLKPGATYTNPFGSDKDRARMNPRSGGEDLDRPAGPTDPQVWILAARSPTGKPIAVLANYSLHYVGGMPANGLSSDYFGAFASVMGRLLKSHETNPAFVAMLSNGTSGDINNSDFFHKVQPRYAPYEKIYLVANDVAAAALKAYQQIKWQEHAPITMKEQSLELGVRKPTAAEVAQAKKLLTTAKRLADGSYYLQPDVYANETVAMYDYPATVNAKLQAIRIGTLGITAIPCEVFVEIGLELKARSPFKSTFTIELANGYNGYLPTAEHHKLGGYETWRARSAYLAEDSAAKITTTLLQMLGNVANR